MRTVALVALALVAVNAFVVNVPSEEEKYLAMMRNRVIPEEALKLTGQELVDYVNKVQTHYVAEFAGFSETEMRTKVMNAKYAELPEGVETAAELPVLATIPDTFDARTHWSSCNTIKEIRDQSECGSCWAHGAAEAISDRICITSAGKNQPEISVDDVLSCCGSTCGSGCEGGYPIQAFKWWVSQGMVTGGSYDSQSGCKPYPFSPCGTHGTKVYPKCPTKEYSTPACSKTCHSGYATSYTNDKHFGKSAYAVSKTVTAIQTEIMTNGPVEAAYTVYEDFYNYKSGVYVHTGGAQVGGHAVKILGWGVDGKNPYWLVANSWNTDWGEKGFFRILRGANECGIEAAIVAGLPK